MTRADAIASLQTHAARYFAPREVPDIVAWLEGNIQLVDKDSDYKGPFSTDNCPDVREILRSCVSRDVETTVIVGPPQSYKSTILLGVAAYTVAVDPGGIGWIFGSADVGRAFSQTRIQPTVEATAALRAMKPEDPDAYKSLELGFRSCTLRIGGSNSPNNLASFPYKRVIGDEVDKYPPLVRQEAGTLDLLLLRTEQVAHHNHIFVSTPTVPHGTIWRAALRGDCRRYHVPCPHCSQLFTQRFEHLIFETLRTGTGAYDFEKIARTAHLRCPHCGNEIWEHHRRDMLHAGQWMADAIEIADARRAEHDLIADPRRRSYFRNCFNVLHPNRTFARIAEKHLMAGRDPSARQNFTNGHLAEVHEEKAQAYEADVIAKRVEGYLHEDSPPPPGAPIPLVVPTPLLPNANGALVLVAGVDVQGDRLECEIVAYGEGEETWGVQYTVIPGLPTERATWDRLDELLMRRWVHPLGYVLTPACVAIDTGHQPEEVYKYIRRSAHRRVIAVKGSSGGYGEPALSRPRKSGVKAVPLWMVGTVTMKEMIYARLRIVEPGPGMMHFPANPRRGYDAEYFRGLTAEKCVERFHAGRKVKKFINPSGRRNEPLDIRGYAHAAYIFLNPDFQAISQKIAQLEIPLSSGDEAPHVPDSDATEPEAPAVAADDTGPSAMSHEEAASVASAEFDPETGRISHRSTDAPGAEMRPNTYEPALPAAVTAKIAIAPAPAQPAPPRRPRRMGNVLGGAGGFGRW